MIALHSNAFLTGVIGSWFHHLLTPKCDWTTGQRFPFPTFHWLDIRIKEPIKFLSGIFGGKFYPNHPLHKIPPSPQVHEFLTLHSPLPHSTTTPKLTIRFIFQKGTKAEIGQKPNCQRDNNSSMSSTRIMRICIRIRIRRTRTMIRGNLGKLCV